MDYSAKVLLPERWWRCLTLLLTSLGGVSKVASFSVHVITSIASVLISAGGMGVKGGLQMIGAGVVLGGTCLYVERNFYVLQSVSCFISPTPSCNLIGQ